MAWISNFIFVGQGDHLIFVFLHTIGGENDNIFPAAFTKKIAGAYKDAHSISDFKSFPGCNHFICGEKGWEEVAEYVSGWINKVNA